MTLDAFFESYYRLRPVNATFTGVHDHDHRLPDWSPEGLAAGADEMRALRASLAATGEFDTSLHDASQRDRALAIAFLDVQIAAERNWGRYPFFEAAFLGGAPVTLPVYPTGASIGSTLRGYDLNRFAGDASLAGNLEVRAALGKFIREGRQFQIDQYDVRIGHRFLLVTGIYGRGAAGPWVQL